MKQPHATAVLPVFVLRSVAATFALLLSLSGAALAEPVFSFESSPGKLPKTIVPVHYAIELTPDLESLALPGVEIVDIEVREPATRLTLNAVDTTFASASIDEDAQRAEVTLDAGAQTATLSFARPIAPGGRVMVARALESIAISADLKARALPPVDAWIKERK